MLRPDVLLRRAWRLPRDEKKLAVEAAVALTLACAAVRWSPGRQLHRLLRFVPPSRRRANSSPSVDALLWIVERVAQVHPCQPQCLERALAGRAMLARRGRSSTLVIGARQPVFEAHAWLEVDGRVVPPDVRAFHPLWRSS